MNLQSVNVCQLGQVNFFTSFAFQFCQLIINIMVELYCDHINYAQRRTMTLAHGLMSIDSRTTDTDLNYYFPDIILTLKMTFTSRTKGLPFIPSFLLCILSCFSFFLFLPFCLPPLLPSFHSSFFFFFLIHLFMQCYAEIHFFKFFFKEG